MRIQFHHVIEMCRVQAGIYATRKHDRNGVFHLRAPTGDMLTVMISDGTGWRDSGFALPAWEHVSVSKGRRSPTWEEMHWVKQQFFDDEECVLQLHPPQSLYRNFHPHCLHLWRPIGVEFPLPPAEAVAPATTGVPS